jgi:cbb3-type cytochrome oxidase subunit 3
MPDPRIGGTITVAATIAHAPVLTSEDKTGNEMRNRAKSILVGLGFAFGLQVIISLAYTGLAYSAGHSRTALPEGTISIIVLGVTLGAFLIGGFVVGWTEERLPVVDAVAVTLLTLIITAVVYLALPSGNKAQFVSGVWLTDQTGSVAVTVPTMLFVAVTVIGAVIGAYWGWRTALPSEGPLANIAVLIGLMGIVFGPFILLAVGRDPTNSSNPGLPLYFLAIVLALLLIIVGVGFWLFTREARRESTYEGDISISPEHHKKSA